jgi:hypothetical protein
MPRSYVKNEWLPNHVIEATTRETYRYVLDRYLLPELGDLRIAEVLPNDVRQWIARLQDPIGVKPPTIVKCKVVLDAIFTTALHDQVVFLHPGKGVRTRRSRPGPDGSSPPSSTAASTTASQMTQRACSSRRTSSPGSVGAN